MIVILIEILTREEFAIILPGTNEKGAIEIAEKVRRAIEKLEILSTKGTLKLTISNRYYYLNILIFIRLTMIYSPGNATIYKSS